MKLFDSALYYYLKLLKKRDRRKTGLDHFDPESVSNILVVSSTAIGDTLLSTPAIRAVRKRYPGARIIALLNRKNMELFSNISGIDGVVPYYGGYRRLRATIDELSKYKFDLALILHGNEPQATPMCYLSGARFIIKLPNNSRFNFLLSNQRPIVEWEEMGHGIEGRLKVAELADCRADGFRMELPLDEADFKGADAFLKNNGALIGAPLFGFQPGASTLSRQWFPERFVELGRMLLEKHPSARIVLTGSASEAALCSKIAEGIGAKAINAAGKLPLKQAAALIKRLRFLVTGDTGPMHVAIALGTPVVALYAVSDPARTGPFYDREIHRVIKKERTCEPCVSKKCTYQRCMEAIGSEEVYGECASIIDARQSGNAS